MRVLLLALALLFTGAHGKYFWQKDKPHEDHNLWKILENAVAIAKDSLGTLDYSDITEKFQLKEKIEAAKDNSEHLKKVLQDYYEALQKGYHDKMHANFPVFMDKVYPVIKNFDNNVEELFKKSVQEAWPVTSDLVSGVGTELRKCLESLSDIAAKSRDRIRAEIDDVRTKVQPYAEEVKAEYEKYKESVGANLGDKTKNVKEELEKDLEILHEKLKPYLEELKKHIPHAEDLRKELNEFVKDIHDFFTSEAQQ